MAEIWPVDWPATMPDDINPQEKALAEAYAAQTLRMLTLDLVGGTLVTVRPPVGCQNPVRYPHEILAGLWGMECGCLGGCTCPARSSVRLAPPVGRVEQVMIDGIIVPESTYRLVGANLVRLNGVLWPSCQQEILVTYLNGTPVDAVGRHAAGILAMEWLKAIRGKACRLPANVTGLTRQGVTMEISTGLFPGGVTGINEVDLYIARFNPNGLKVRPGVWSPDYTSMESRGAY